MGWRIDFYKANENEPLILTTEEDGYVSINVNGEIILDDTATDVWCELKQEEEFRKLDQLIRQQQNYRKESVKPSPAARLKKLLTPT